MRHFLTLEYVSSSSWTLSSSSISLIHRSKVSLSFSLIGVYSDPLTLVNFRRVSATFALAGPSSGSRCLHGRDTSISNALRNSSILVKDVLSMLKVSPKIDVLEYLSANILAR